MRRSSSCAAGIVLAAWLVSGTQAFAAAKDFDFKDPKKVNSIAFVLDSALEPIMGVTTGITGKVTFDPENPKATTGKFEVDAKSLHIENKGMKDTLHGADWLDVAKYPAIEFTIKEVTDAKKTGENVYDLTVNGDLTCKGVTKPVSTVVKATYLPDELQNRTSRLKGDLLVLRANFVIKRTDYDIKKDMGDRVVADNIELRVAIAGGAQK